MVGAGSGPSYVHEKAVSSERDRIFSNVTVTVICRAGAPLRSTAVGEVLFWSSPWSGHTTNPVHRRRTTPPPQTPHHQAHMQSPSAWSTCGPVTLSPLVWKKCCLRGGGSSSKRGRRISFSSVYLFTRVVPLCHSTFSVFRGRTVCVEKAPTASKSPSFLGQPASLEIPLFLKRDPPRSSFLQDGRTTTSSYIPYATVHNRPHFCRVRPFTLGDFTMSPKNDGAKLPTKQLAILGKQT